MKLSRHLSPNSLVCALALLLVLSSGQRASARPELSPALGRMVADSVASNKNISVLVFLDASPVRASIHTIETSRSLSRRERINKTTHKLRAIADNAPKAVIRFLEEHSVIPVRRLWIATALAASIPAGKLEQLSSYDGIQLIIPDVDLELVAPVSVEPAPLAASGISGPLNQMNVPSLWRRGLTGRGRLVCSFDTGVQQSHPALVAKWRGNHAPLHSSWFSTILPDTLPYDKAGHGTHTMGIMLGSTPTDSFGVAPGAEWITAGVIDQGKSLNLTIGDILGAFQWALNPDGDTTTTDDVPDVILNSWGVPKGIFPPCDATFSTAIANVEAAGIVTVFAAGNEGPNPSTLRQPADNASSPLNTFSVGAVDSLLNVAAFSSRGPSYCDTAQKKPELVAPGVGIRSSTKGSAYTLMSGTSMAAPFVAGVVTLLREYNPDASVSEIKQALVASAQDIGQPGDDNASGYGFIDAVRAIDFMPLPVSTVFSIADNRFDSQGIAMPGVPANLSLTVTNSTGRIDQIGGQLVCQVSGTATVDSFATTFTFGVGGTTAISSPKFTLTFDSAVPHGTSVPFRLYLGAPGGPTVDSLDFTLMCGITPAGTVAAHSTPDLTLGVSDFGQYGLSAGSIYNAGGAGLHFQGSSNLLYEAGIVIGRNALQLSSAVRDSLGRLRSSDFVPSAPLASSTGTNHDQHFTARFSDSRSDIPIPITISQETITRDVVSAGDVVIFKFRLVNTSPDKLTGLHFGFLSDFDLGSFDTVGYEPGANLAWQGTANGPYVGLVGLNNIDGFKSLANGLGKQGYSKSTLYGLISTGGASVSPIAATGDQMLLINSPTIELFSGDSSELAFAMVVAGDLNGLLIQAALARSLYLNPTGVDDPLTELPRTFELEQNYPNPFNPSTTISFNLASPSEVSLTILNVLGQKVRLLAGGKLAAGEHILQWDGRDDAQDEVSSGVYFYRMICGSQSETRKMVLVR